MQLLVRLEILASNSGSFAESLPPALFALVSYKT